MRPLMRPNTALGVDVSGLVTIPPGLRRVVWPQTDSSLCRRSGDVSLAGGQAGGAL